MPGGQGTLDLKAQGARIFVDAARIFALAQAIPRTSTAERLREARTALGMSEAETRAAVDAFHVIQAARLRLQARAQSTGASLQNRVDPASLGRLEVTLLKEGLHIARELQRRLALEYQL